MALLHGSLSKETDLVATLLHAKDALHNEDVLLLVFGFRFVYIRRWQTGARVAAGLWIGLLFAFLRLLRFRLVGSTIVPRASLPAQLLVIFSGDTDRAAVPWVWRMG